MKCEDKPTVCLACKDGWNLEQNSCKKAIGNSSDEEEDLTLKLKFFGNTGTGFISLEFSHILDPSSDFKNNLYFELRSKENLEKEEIFPTSVSLSGTAPNRLIINFNLANRNINSGTITINALERNVIRKKSDTTQEFFGYPIEVQAVNYFRNAVTSVAKTSSTIATATISTSSTFMIITSTGSASA